MYYVSFDFPINERSTDSFKYISHHGILGQKWGVRRYQNKDGTLTRLGKKRYKEDSAKTLSYEKDFRTALDENMAFLKAWPISEMDGPAQLVMKNLVDGRPMTNKEREYLDRSDHLSEKAINEGQRFMLSLIELHDKYGSVNVSKMSPELIKMGNDLLAADSSQYHGTFYEWSKRQFPMDPEEYDRLIKDYERRGKPYRIA